MPDHGSDAMKALEAKGAEKSQLKETFFCKGKRNTITKFICSSLEQDPLISWTDLVVNSVHRLFAGRTEWRWYQVNAEGKHVITSSCSEGRCLYRRVVKSVRDDVDGYSRAVLAAIEKKKDDAKKARIHR